MAMAAPEKGHGKNITKEYITMKRKNTSAIICIILILSLLLTAGCGKSDNGGTNDSADGRYKTVT